nr:MAG TPA: terminase small subunit [Caudoviricetes sp.]
MLNTKQYELAHAVAAGEDHVEAYMRIYGSSRETAGKNAKKTLTSPEVAALLEDLRAADKASVDAIKRELTACLLNDSRNETLPTRDRLAARAQLAKIYGLEKSNVNLSADDEFRQAIIQAAKGEPLVKPQAK